MKRPISPFLDNNPRLGFYCGIRKRTSALCDTPSCAHQNCSPHYSRVWEGFLLRTSESLTLEVLPGLGPIRR